MGTWGIAQEMAKINEQNIARLEGNGRFSFARLRMFGLHTQPRTYRYKQADQALIFSIRETLVAENKAAMIKRIVLGGALIVSAAVALYHMLTMSF